MLWLYMFLDKKTRAIKRMRTISTDTPRLSVNEIPVIICSADLATRDEEKFDEMIVKAFGVIVAEGITPQQKRAMQEKVPELKL